MASTRDTKGNGKCVSLSYMCCIAINRGGLHSVEVKWPVVYQTRSLNKPLCFRWGIYEHDEMRGWTADSSCRRQVGWRMRGRNYRNHLVSCLCETAKIRGNMWPPLTLPAPVEAFFRRPKGVLTNWPSTCQLWSRRRPYCYFTRVARDCAWSILFGCTTVSLI